MFARHSSTLAVHRSWEKVNFQLPRNTNVNHYHISSYNITFNND